MSETSKEQWTRIILSAFVFIATISMAGFALFLCYLHVTSSATDDGKSYVKLGKNFEVSSNIVGLLVLFITFFFFIKAGSWFHSCFDDSQTISKNELLEFVAKQGGKQVSRNEIMEFITKG